MKNKLIYALAIVAFQPVTVQAQAYKCKQADGGVSFQSQPCPANTTSSVVSTTPANGTVAKPASRQVAGIAPVGRLLPATGEGVARRSTAANPYPYATAADIAQLKAGNAELQDMVAKAKAADPNWHESEQKTRLVEQADAINKRIQADTQPKR